jgi:cyanophycinase
LGFGIDKDTEMVVDGDKLRLTGHASVMVIDDSEVTHHNLDEVIRDEVIAICGIKLHILPYKFCFNLRTRKPISQD